METLFPAFPEPATALQPFNFFGLPAELRHKILGLLLKVDRIIDIDFSNWRQAAIFPVSKRFHAEGAAVFYGINTFRLFPTHGRVEGNKVHPLIMRIPPLYRAELVSLELRLGPFWSKPPKCWKVSDALRLEDATAVRVLKVFVEVDPSHPVFNGFRRNKDFYTHFAGALLKGVIAKLPNLEEIHIDGYPSVNRGSPLVKRLVEEAVSGNKRVSWGHGGSLSCECHHGLLKSHSLVPCTIHIDEDMKKPGSADI